VKKRPQPARRVHRRPAYLFIDFAASRLLGSVLSVGTIAAVTRLAPVATVGTFTATIGFAQLLFIFLDLGSGPALVRAAATSDQSRSITIYMLTRLTLTIITVVGGAIFVLVLFNSSAWIPAWTALGFVAASFYGILAPIGQITGDSSRYRYATLMQGSIIFVCVTWILLADRNASATMLVTAYSVAGLVTTTVTVWWARRFIVPLSFPEILSGVKANLRSIATLGAATATASVYNRIDQALLLRLSGATVSAQYGIAYRILEQMRLIPSTLQFSLGSFLASCLTPGKGLSEQDQRQLRRIGLYGGPGLSCVVIALADLAVAIVAGPKYRAAVTPVIILAVSLSLAVMTYITVTCAIMAHRDRLYLRVAAAAVVANICANLIFIPQWGATASAVATVGTDLLVVSVVSSQLGRRLGSAGATDIAAALAISIAAAAAKFWVKDLSLEWNVLGSGVLAAIGGLGLAQSYRTLKAIPQPGPQTSVDVGSIL
jgi:O-antigen/teichoic acid export membrane protein